MTRYNTIHKINDTWGSYEEKGKTPQWVNLKTGERYDIKNKETFTEFLKRLKETNNMTLKTISDQAQTFTFTYDFSDIDTAQVASKAVLGYMLGTYHAPVIETTIKGKGQLVLEYAEDNDLSETFKRICDGFNNGYSNPEASDTIESEYIKQRMQQLTGEHPEDLANLVAQYELELLDYAERLLSDDPIPMTDMTATVTLEILDSGALILLKELDTEKEYSGLWE